MMYYILYGLMVIGYAGVSFYAPDFKMKVIGILLTVVNALLFWK